MEGRALCPGCPRFPPTSAAHHLAQAFAHRQSQPRAAVLARGRSVHLGEGLEQPVQPVGRDADAGIAHGEMQIPSA